MSIAAEKHRTGDLDGSIALARTVLDNEFRSGEMVYRGLATTTLIEALLDRQVQGDVDEARIAVEN